MATKIETPNYDDSYFQYHLLQIYRTVLRDFRNVLRSSIFFHLFFFSLICIELIAFLPFFAKSVIAALGLGTIFLTGFSYLVLHFYYQARKPECLLRLKETFLRSCKTHISIPSGETQHHLSIADALLKLACYLDGFENNLYKLPTSLYFLAPLITKLSGYFSSQEVFKMKRLLLSAAVEEHLKQIRVTPTDLEVHASLATTYVSQSKIYRKAFLHRKEHTIFENLFRTSARLAIEEFRILNHYAPNDPWVHEQLAQGYRELEKPEEELQELEILLKLKPQDKEILYRLGQLYFNQGMNAKGLQIYEELKKSNFKKAEELIISYGDTQMN